MDGKLMEDKFGWIMEGKDELVGRDETIIGDGKLICSFFLLSLN